MKTRPAAQSAFFNPRVLISFAFCAVGVLLALLAFALYPGATVLAQAPQGNSGIQFGQSYHNDVSPALRDLPALWPPPVPKDKEPREANLNPKLHPLHRDVPDPVVQGSVLGTLLPQAMPTPILN